MSPPLRGLCPLALALLTVPTGCVVLPKTTQVYDPDCQLHFREMSLEAVNLGVGLNGCHNAGCVGGVAVVSAIAAASVVISGSIVVVGNTVFWFEKRGRCLAPARPVA